VRAIALMGAFLALSGCVTASGTGPETGAWKIDRGYDGILRKPTATAQLNSRSRNEREAKLRYPHDQLQIGSLQLTCFENAPVIRFEFNHRIGSNRTSVLSYRFDDTPGRDAQVRFLQTYKIAVMEDAKEVEQFVEQLRVSTKLYIRVTSHVAGTSSVEFPLKGAPAAIDAAFQNCPVDPASKPRTAGVSPPRPWHFVSA
jgi:hypothetical protein